ncbi:hypothetical protein ABBQ38_012579 [Trebouxia sp. C0009 RCD-2024]
MPPPPTRRGQKRQHEQTLLDEDEWTDRIEAIIQRDYFPDLPKLQNKLEWLQAVRSGNPSQLQQAQLNIAQRRAGIRTPIGATPAGFGTPGASLLRTPGLGLTPMGGTPSMTPRLGVNTAGQVVSSGPQDPTLDKFFAQHNSEDNASFQELLKASQQRLRKAKPWLFKNHNPPTDTTQLLLTSGQTDTQAQQLPAATVAPAPGDSAAQQPTSSQADASDAPAAQQPSPSSSGQALSHANAETTDLGGAVQGADQPSTSSGQMVLLDSDASVSTRDADRVVQRPAVQTDGFGTTGQGSQTLLSWPHTNKSALYYDSSQRDVVPYTEEELADMVQGPPKQIKHSATRFPSDFDTSQQTSKAEGAHGQAGMQGQQPGAIRGYGVLNTPAFTPGLDASPLMTWGDIGSTPIRLDQEDDIHVSTSTGPAFKMAGVPARDQLGRGIAQKATLSLKRKAAARAGTPMAGGLPTGRRRAAGTPLPLSSAGKRLASSLRGGTPATDVQLRASYKSTPRGRMASVQPSPRGGDGFNTPVVHSTKQPKMHGMSALEEIRAHALAAHATNSSKPADRPGADLTDDLLNI